MWMMLETHRRERRKGVGAKGVNVRSEAWSLPGNDIIAIEVKLNLNGSPTLFKTTLYTQLLPR